MRPRKPDPRKRPVRQEQPPQSQHRSKAGPPPKRSAGGHKPRPEAEAERGPRRPPGRPAVRPKPHPVEPAAERQPRRPRPEGSSGQPGVWVYGAHAVAAALANPARHPRRILALPDSEFIRKLKDPPVSIESVDRQRLDSILGHNAVHQGIAILCDPIPEANFDEACEPVPGRRNVIVLLDQVTDPHNVGAIIRSAAAFGARAVIMTDRNAPEATGTLAKAASGALERVPLLRVPNLARALDDVADLGYWRIGLDASAPANLAETAATIENVALVLGAEGEGLRRLTIDKCDHLARLPMTGEMESLNVSNAAAVALYALAVRT